MSNLTALIQAVVSDSSEQIIVADDRRFELHMINLLIITTALPPTAVLCYYGQRYRLPSDVQLARHKLSSETIIIGMPKPNKYADSIKLETDGPAKADGFPMFRGENSQTHKPLEL